MAEPWLTIAAGPATTDPAPGRVRGSACRTRPAFFREWARALRLPAHFGANWDALADALADLPPRHLIAVDDADQMLADEPPGELALLITLLRRLPDEQRPRLALTAPPPRLAWLRERAAAAFRGDGSRT